VARGKGIVPIGKAGVDPPPEENLIAVTQYEVQIDITGIAVGQVR